MFALGSCLLFRAYPTSLELNLRTYVVDEHGRPGVWFYSLDTPKRLPNWIARTFFHLNYRLARIQVEEKGSLRSYRSELWMETGWDTPQEYKWDRVGEPFIAEPGSLDFFLAERYRLFAFNKKETQLMSGASSSRTLSSSKGKSQVLF